jgi:hypothetical protein
MPREPNPGTTLGELSERWLEHRQAAGGLGCWSKTKYPGREHGEGGTGLQSRVSSFLFNSEIASRGCATLAMTHALEDILWY